MQNRTERRNARRVTVMQGSGFPGVPERSLSRLLRNAGLAAAGRQGARVARVLSAGAALRGARAGVTPCAPPGRARTAPPLLLLLLEPGISPARLTRGDIGGEEIAQASVVSYSVVMMEIGANPSCELTTPIIKSILISSNRVFNQNPRILKLKSHPAYFFFHIPASFF